jgi:uncharacterized protein YndB with AHSA1/START domain
MAVDTGILQREIRVAARPETVFAFFTDPARVVRWMGIEAALEPRAGGIFRVKINDQHTAQGEFVDVTRPSRMVFTFGWDQEAHPIPPGSTTVEVTFTPDGDGTLVRLMHRGLPADAVADHTQGWDQLLARLSIAAAEGEPGPDPMAGGSTEAVNAR